MALTKIKSTGIEANAVTVSIIADGSITDDKIAANAITAAKISAGSITSEKITANAITEVQISVSALANVLIAGDNIIIESNARISSTGGGDAGLNPFLLAGM